MNKKKIVVVIEDGVVITVKSSDPDVHVDIVDLDSDYANSELREKVYEKVESDTGLRDCKYNTHCPGNDR